MAGAVGIAASLASRFQADAGFCINRLRRLADGSAYLQTKVDPQTHPAQPLKVDALTGQAAPFFDAAKMEAAFAAWPGLSRDDARTIAHPPTYQMNSSQTAALINFANDLFYYQFGSDNATRLTMSPAPEVGEEFRPAGRMVNFACRNNSHIVEVATARAGVARFECRRPG